MIFKRTILITGGAGFIGSHVVKLFVRKYPEYLIINYDKLTYAGNLQNLEDVKNEPNYKFVKADICDFETVSRVIREYEVDGIIHLAAESHVDRSIIDPLSFVKTNVIGTVTLLEAARQIWEKSQKGYEDKLFYHISTDEVFGALEIDMPEGKDMGLGHISFGTSFFSEHTPYSPRSPYSASKASSNHFVSSYHHTYGMPTVITSCSNNYGPYQFPEKLIPLFINNICEGRALPVYGKGENIRDWLYVEDHARAIDIVFHKASAGDYFNIGGFNEWKNIELIRLLVKIVDRKLGNPDGFSDNLITFVKDRKGHDLRYAIDSRHITNTLGWKPSLQFDEGLERTVEWYLDNQEWLENVTSGDYRSYYDKMYKQ